MKKTTAIFFLITAEKIMNWSTGELLYKNLLPDDVLPILYQTATDNRQTILTYDNECILTEIPTTRTYRKKHSSTKCRYAV